MGKRVVYFSDLTNKIIDDGEELARIVIVQHPALQNGPVSLEISDDEVESIRSGALRVVSLQLSQSDGSAPEAVTMEIEAFNRLASDRNIADVIRRAELECPPRKQTRPAPAAPTAHRGIWQWLVGVGLTLVVVGLLAWTGLLSVLTP